jgi:DNA-binding transcriptional MerR regulator
MRIGEVARMFSVSTDTLRRLERRRGLTPKRDWAGQRRYSPEDIERLRLVLFPSPENEQVRAMPNSSRRVS